MSVSDPVPDPAPVLELIDAFRRSKTMFAAVSLGVFEALHQGPAQASSLTARLLGTASGAGPDALERLLDSENTSVTLQTMGRAAAALGKTLTVSFKDAA